jgi:peptidoglycan-N-acetylglucosamine deacetylase
MFRYSSISISFTIVLFALIIQVQYEGNPWWILLIPIFAYLAFLVVGSIKISLNFYFKSFCRVKTKEKIIALTFDDGPDPQVTPKLLDILKRKNIPAAFFCIGQKVDENSELAKKIVEDGHLIGNHTYTHHTWFDLFSRKHMLKEIEMTDEAIKRAIGKIPMLFRPPYGVTNPALKYIVEKTNLTSIGWSLRSFDTIHDPEKVMKKLKRKTKPGGIVLFHDTNEKIIVVVTEYLAWLKANEFKVESLETMLNLQAYDTL